VSAPCLKCGAETDHVVEFTGKIEGEVFMCDPCLGPAMSEIDQLRAQFDELLSFGVPRDRANAIMIDRIQCGIEEHGRHVS
jgi:hypothetical protein